MGYDEKLEFLLKQAAQVFAEKGFHRASIRDIAKASGMSLAGLYYYFKSKDELLFMVMRHWLNQVTTLVESRLKETRDPQEKLAILIETHLEFSINHMKEMKVLSHEGETLEGPYYQEISSNRRRYYRLCSSVIEELGKQARIKDLHQRSAVMSLFGMMNWIYNWYNPELDGGAIELARSMKTIFLSGILKHPQDQTRVISRSKGKP